MSQKQKHPKPPAYAPTIPAAAKWLLVTEDEVRRAKNSDCIAFKPSGKIHLGQLRDWLARNPAPAEEPGLESKESADARKARAAADIMEVKAQEVKGNVIPKEEVVAVFSRFVFEAKAKLLEIPDTAAAKIAIEPTELKAAQIIRLSICDALTGLAGCKWLKEVKTPVIESWSEGGGI